MSFGKWYTIDDVMEDLAKASGQLVSELNEKYVVVGKQRPHYDEDEFEGMHLNGHFISCNDELKPDLDGIKEMIRLVDEYSTTESSFAESDNINKKRETFNNKDTIVISKLNPNVPDFVPKFSPTGSNSTIIDCTDSPVDSTIRVEEEGNNPKNNLKEEINDLNSATVVEQNNDNDRTHTHTCNKKILIPINKRIDISSLEPKEKEKLRENLRTSICHTSQTNCVKVKRQRNVAIATLMKLFTGMPPTKQADDEEATPKLMTPQYFETDRKISAISIEQPSLNKTTSETTTSSETEITHIDNLKESIEKVNKWLKGPQEHSIKSPLLFLGPVTFKRKGARNSPDAPTANSNSISSETAPVETIKGYVSSPYANELTEKYKKRVKETEGRQDIWTKLQAELKLRDEIIKNKKLSSPES